MRLRRESGDYSFRVATVDEALVAEDVRAGLHGEDLIGNVVEFDGTYEVITSVSAAVAGVYTCLTASLSLAYTAADGSVEATAIEVESGTG